MTHIPSAFFKGLKGDKQSSSSRSSGGISYIKMLQCLRWAMKKYDLDIEIERAKSFASTQMSLQLVKYDKNGSPVNTGLDIKITDHIIERGLFELEYKAMQYINPAPSKGLENVLKMLRKNELRMLPHSDLNNKIIMENHTIRINYFGKDPNFGDDMFCGFLLQNENIIASTEPQKRMGYILDNLENALSTKKRESHRKKIAEYMLKFDDTTDSAYSDINS